MLRGVMQTCSADRSRAPRARGRARSQRHRARQPEPGRRRRDRRPAASVLGEGWHEELGGCHAEVNAIAACARRRPRARATLYVTLEPCCHFGPHAALHRRDPRRRDPPRRRRPATTRPRRPRGAASGSCATRASRWSSPTASSRAQRAAAQPGLSQARPHRPPVGALQVGDDARRQGRDARRRLEMDLRRREPRARAPLARRGRRRRDRDRHGAHRRPAADGARRERPPPAAARRLRLARAAAAVLAARRARPPRCR